MKTKIYLILFLSMLLASCSSLQQSAVNDDIYYSPKDESTSGGDIYKNPTYDKSQSTVFNNKYDEKIAGVLEDDSKSDIDTVIYESEDEYENPYQSIVVDDYDEAYERRVDAMRSPWYGMNNYYNIYFSDDYWYAMSYMNDPFYNVVIVGDRIWVEPYWMSSWYGFRPSWHYSGYYGYPYYYGYGSYYSSWYYNPYYYNSYYRDYPFYSNTNYVSSSFHSYRQRTLAGNSRTGIATGRASRELPETYMGRDVRSSSTVKSGIDRQSTRTVRAGSSNTRDISGNGIASETIRVRPSSQERTGTAIGTTRQGQTEPGRSYTRPQQSTRSSYSSPSRSATRYSRPKSTGSSSGGSSSTRSSTYSPNRSGNSSSGSSYSPRRSSGSSGSSSYSRPSRPSGSSGSVRSSGSTRSSGSSGSSRSSGSSSGGSSRGRR